MESTGPTGNGSQSCVPQRSSGADPPSADEPQEHDPEGRDQSAELGQDVRHDATSMDRWSWVAHGDISRLRRLREVESWPSTTCSGTNSSRSSAMARERRFFTRW